jgi:hypothetical protein
MVIAKQFRSIQSMLPRISSKLTKDIQTAKDKSLCYVRERERERLMKLSKRLINNAAYLDEIQNVEFIIQLRYNCFFSSSSSSSSDSSDSSCSSSCN